MATSSIFANIKITDPEKAETFINALETSANESPRKPSVPIIPTVTDLATIRELMAKRLESVYTDI